MADGSPTRTLSDEDARYAALSAEALAPARSVRDAAAAELSTAQGALSDAEARLAAAVAGIAAAQQATAAADAAIEAVRQAVVASTEAGAAAQQMKVGMKEKAQARSEKMAGKDLDGDGDVGLTARDNAIAKAADDLQKAKQQGSAAQAAWAQAQLQLDNHTAANTTADADVRAGTAAVLAATPALEGAEKQLSAMNLVEERKATARKAEREGAKTAAEHKADEADVKADAKAQAVREKKAASWLKGEEKRARKEAKKDGAPDDWAQYMSAMPDELMTADELAEAEQKKREPPPPPTAVELAKMEAAALKKKQVRR